MVSDITSGERLQLANFLERHAVRLKPDNHPNNSIKDLVAKAQGNFQSNSNFASSLEDSAYAKYLDKVFSSGPRVSITGSGIDIQISDEAQKILDLTSSENEKK